MPYGMSRCCAVGGHIQPRALEARPQPARAIRAHLHGVCVARAVHRPLVRGLAARHGEVPVGAAIVVPGSRAVVEREVELRGRRDERHCRLSNFIFPPKCYA